MCIIWHKLKNESSYENKENLFGDYDSFVAVNYVLFRSNTDADFDSCGIKGKSHRSPRRARNSYIEAKTKPICISRRVM